MRDGILSVQRWPGLAYRNDTPMYSKIRKALGMQSRLENIDYTLAQNISGSIIDQAHREQISRRRHMEWP